jgi:hypothetical protein
MDDIPVTRASPDSRSQRCPSEQDCGGLSGSIVQLGLQPAGPDDLDMRTMPMSPANAWRPGRARDHARCPGDALHALGGMRRVHERLSETLFVVLRCCGAVRHARLCVRAAARSQWLDRRGMNQNPAASIHGRRSLYRTVQDRRLHDTWLTAAAP